MAVVPSGGGGEEGAGEQPAEVNVIVAVGILGAKKDLGARRKH